MHCFKGTVKVLHYFGGGAVARGTLEVQCIQYTGGVAVN